MSTETVAVDREALDEVIERALVEAPDELQTGAAADWKLSYFIVSRLIASGILRDVREVQHEHGERIADHFEYMEVGGQFSNEQVADKIRGLSPPHDLRPGRGPDPAAT